MEERVSGFWRWRRLDGRYFGYDEAECLSLGQLEVNARQWRRDQKPDGLDLRGMNVKRIEVVADGSRRVMKREHETFQASSFLSF